MKTLLPALLLLACPAAAEETVSFTLAPSAQKLRLGERFTVEVQASLPAKYELRPDTASADTADFALLAFEPGLSEVKGEKREQKFLLRAQAFALGVSTFPEITWLLTAPGEEPGKARSPRFAVEIAPAFETRPEEDIRDIYPPLRFVPWHWIALGLLALAAASWWLHRRLAPRAAALFVKPPWADTRQPYQRARDRLDRLAACPLPGAGRIKEYYIGLSSILRLYLREEFAIDAAQMTTADLARELKRTGAGLAVSLRTRELLQKADLVKFARLQPADAEADTQALRELLGEFTRAAEAAKAPPPAKGGAA